MNNTELTHSDRRIYSTKRAAAFAGVSVSTWRKMYSDGRAPLPVRITRTRLGWPLHELESYVNSLPRRV